MIYEKEPLVSKFVSLPKGYTGFKCSYINAGIIKGILYAAEFVSDQLI